MIDWEKYHKENQEPHKQYGDAKIYHFANISIDCKSILEVGCGLGHNIERYGSRATGIDISVYAIIQAVERYPTSRWLVKDMLDMRGSYDVVLSNNCLTHIQPKDLDKAIDKLIELSTRLIITTEAYGYTEHTINWHRGKNEMFTVHVAKRFRAKGHKIITDYNIDQEYRRTIIRLC